MYLLELDIHGKILNQDIFITPRMSVQLNISNRVITSLGLTGITQPSDADLTPKDCVNDKLAILKNNYQQALVSHFRKDITTNFLKRNIGKQYTKAQFNSLLQEISDDYLNFVDQIFHQFSVGYGDWILTAIQAQEHGYDYVVKSNLNLLVHQELGLNTNVYLTPVMTKSNDVIVTVNLYNSSNGNVYNLVTSSCNIHDSTTYVVAIDQNPPR